MRPSLFQCAPLVVGLMVAACSGDPETSSGADRSNQSGSGGQGMASGGGFGCSSPPCDAGAGGGSVTAGGSGGAGAGTGGQDASSGGNTAHYDCTRSLDTATYGMNESVPPSQMPPQGLPVSETPLFVALSFDDNPESSGMTWATGLYGSHGVPSTFFHTTDYAPAALNQWRAAYDAGLEVGLHTQSHATSYQTSRQSWASEVASCFNVLTAAFGGGGLGVPRSEIYGFRAPYLEFNDALLSELETQGVWYDSSIQEGFDPSQDGTNLYFPYTLDGGSPGHTYNKSYGFIRSQFELTAHPGLFELPVYALIVPPDSEAGTYGFSPGLRGRISVDDYVETGYRLTGFDYNLWTQAGVSGSEFLAILKYNFDLRRQGNRAPFLFGAHTSDYADGPSSAEKRAAITDFVTYVSQFPEVRVVSYKEVLDFMREPKALSCY